MALFNNDSYEDKSHKILNFLLNQKNIQDNLIRNFSSNNLDFNEFKKSMLKSIQKQSKYLRRVKPLLEKYFNSSLKEIDKLNLEERITQEINRYFNFQLDLVNSSQKLLQNKINYLNSIDSNLNLNDYMKNFEETEKNILNDYNLKQNSFKNYLKNLFDNNKGSSFLRMKKNLLFLGLFGSLSYILLINDNSEYYFEGLVLFISVFGIDFISDKLQDLSSKNKNKNLNDKYYELINIVYNIKS